MLAFLLVLIAGSSWLLVSDLDRHTQAYTRRVGSGLALNQAKQALLSYAMNYPDLRANPDKGPGFLPCPDRNNDGRPESNCAAGTGTTLGRLPFSILGLDDPRDSSGERLWYAVSPAFRNTRSNHTVLNSETPGQLSVDGTGDVVAVVLAPGAPVGAQHTRPGNDAAAYLEGENAVIADGRFSSTAGNDRLAVISRAELMAVVEQRVIHDVRAALARYRAQHSAYPWLAPFAGPHSGGRVLRGAHGGGKNAPMLTDKRRDFKAWGVSPGDRVRNVDDGSVSVVTKVYKNTLEVAGATTGADNDFDKGDVYFIELRGPARALSGAATAGSRGLTLRDSSRNFSKLGVAPGDVIENLDDGSVGTVAAVAARTLTADRLSGGLENDFDSGERYRLRANTGVAAPGSQGLTLVDPQADFVAGGVAGGDMVENLSDGSRGRVHSVAGPTRLTLAGLDFGRANRFRDGDVYRLPRYNGRRKVRKGLLPLHEPGKRFPTGFGVEWRAALADGWVVTGLAPATQPGYAAAVTGSIQSSKSAGALHVNSDSGHCVWLNARVVDCAGVSAAAPFLEGTAGAGSKASALVDVARDFIAAGVKPGDLVEEPYHAVVTRVASAARLDLRQLAPSSPPLAQAGRYRIRTATRSLSGVAGAAGSGRLRDPNRDFGGAGVRAGDVVENVTDGSFGLVTGVAGAEVAAKLYGGKHNAFQAGDDYQVHYAYINRRRYRFNLRYQGNPALRSAAGVRQRDVCLGFGADCRAAPVAVPLPHYDNGVAGAATSGAAGLTLEDAGADFFRAGVVSGDTLFNTSDGSAGMVAALSRHSLRLNALDGGQDNDFDTGDAYRASRPWVVIEDLRDASVVARTALTAPPGGARGSVRVSGIDYYLSEAPGELPPWFTKNKWQRLLYVAYGAGFAPGGGNHCTAGVDCLAVQGRADDREALVVSAGMALAEQDRASGSIAAYYEGENASLAGDDVFAGADISETFNDQVAVVAP